MDNFELRFLPIVHNIMVGNTMAGSCRWSSGGLKCPGSEQDKCTSGGSGHSCWCRVAFLILQFLVWFLRMHVFLSMNVPKAPIQIAPPLRTCTKCCKVLSEKRPFYFEVLEETTLVLVTISWSRISCWRCDRVIFGPQLLIYPHAGYMGSNEGETMVKKQDN